MEETNIVNNTAQPIETPLINPIIPKPKNIYKYLFFITLIILFGATIYFFKNTNNQKIQTLSDNTTKEVIMVTPTEIIKKEIIDENKKQEQGNTKEDIKNIYKAVSVKDDKNSTTKLILIDQKNNETIIEEVKSILPCYGGFNFSSDNNYLHYCNGCLGCYSTLYDIKNKKIIRLNMETEIKGFTSNSKYFYACARSGPGSGGAVVKELSSLKDVFIIKGDYKCQHNRNTGEIMFSEVSPSFDDDGKILSEYKFSEKTGVLTKIK